MDAPDAGRRRRSAQRLIKCLQSVHFSNELLDLEGKYAKINGEIRGPPGSGVIDFMTGVRVRENESIESAIRRFKKLCEKAGILAELRKREHYEKPSVKKKKKAIAAKKRAMRRVRHSF